MEKNLLRFEAWFERNSFPIAFGLLLCFTYLGISPDIAFAADPASTNEQFINEIGNIAPGANNFNSDMKKMAIGFTRIAQVIAIVMTAIAGLMVAFGMQDSTKTMWNFILGIGLIINFGSAASHLFATVPDSAAASNEYTKEALKNMMTEDKDILSQFFGAYYLMIIQGALALKPIAMKLLLIIVMIEVTIQISLDLIEGDKVKFLLTTCLHAGFWLFLIDNWLGVSLLGAGNFNLMNSLSEFFQQVGFTAAGVGGTAVISDSGTAQATGDAAILRPDSIVDNAWTLWGILFSWAKGISFPTSIAAWLVAIVCVVLIALTAIEMFMARIEFYTMALLTMPLLAFGVSKKFSFLSDKTIGAMFNLGIKLAVISFLTGAICPMLNTFTESFKSNGTKGIPGGDLRVCLVMLITVLILYLLTKKIPQLVSGLLSGQPQLGGSQMTQMAASAARTAGAAAGVVRGAAMAAKAGGAEGFGQMAKGTMSNLGRAGLNAIMHRNPVAQGHQSGVQSMVGGFNGADNLQVGGLLGKTSVDKGVGAQLDAIGQLASKPAEFAAKMHGGAFRTAQYQKGINGAAYQASAQAKKKYAESHQEPSNTSGGSGGREGKNSKE